MLQDGSRNDMVRHALFNILFIGTVTFGALIVYRWYVYYAPSPQSKTNKISTANDLNKGLLLGDVKRVTDPNSSIEQQIQFGAGYTPTPTPRQSFQPTAPYYATVYYPWYGAMGVDKTWYHWDYAEHRPPLNWYSNYLPDLNPRAFDPQHELYSSHNIATLYWQLQKLAEARQAVGIASWWGREHPTDLNLKWIVTDVMNRPDNPYPNFRWALYYEDEGPNNPNSNKIIDDLLYIKTTYATQPSYLKIDNKPVIFVHGGPKDGSKMATRWERARAQTGFYVVLKAYPGYESASSAIDSWHEYAPTQRSSDLNKYSYSVSPGYWKQGELPKLQRDLDDTHAAVQRMVQSAAQWKIITTWNEWGEGTAVEPGDQVIQSLNQRSASFDSHGMPFKNAYIDLLHALLPSLARGVR